MGVFKVNHFYGEMGLDQAEQHCIPIVCTEIEEVYKDKQTDKQINTLFIELVPQLTVTMLEKVTSGKLLRWRKHLLDK